MPSGPPSITLKKYLYPYALLLSLCVCVCVGKKGALWMLNLWNERFKATLKFFTLVLPKNNLNISPTLHYKKNFFYSWMISKKLWYDVGWAPPDQVGPSWDKNVLPQKLQKKLHYLIVPHCKFEFLWFINYCAIF